MQFNIFHIFKVGGEYVRDREMKGTVPGDVLGNGGWVNPIAHP